MYANNVNRHLQSAPASFWDSQPPATAAPRTASVLLTQPPRRGVQLELFCVGCLTTTWCGCPPFVLTGLTHLLEKVG